MALPAPKLDDRTFQDLVSEARSMIPRHCPEWTDHNLSDPGITLIELFAWMVDIMLYRLNKVPDKNYIKFMELIGIRLAPAHPATAELTFRLSAPQPAPVTIPAGTEVATIRTETQEAIVFTTDADLAIELPVLSHFLITRDGVNFVEFLNELGNNKPTDLFKEVPQKDNAFYLGYSQPLGASVLAMTIDCLPNKATGVNPNDPPLAWEYWDSGLQDWQSFERAPESLAWLERDGTGALNRMGDVILHLPHSMGATQVGLRVAYWIRCRVVAAKPGQPVYDASPALLSVTSRCMGGRVNACHSVQITNEQLGTSSGNAGQSFHLASSPILALSDQDTVEVRQAGSTYGKWMAVTDFSRSQPEDKHFLCDTGVGEIRFGPGIRQPDGQVKQYGSIPPKGSIIKMSSYRRGGGSTGNVGKNALTVVKSSIPYVASVANRRAASGGADPESLESAMMRAPEVFRTHSRAVTEADFEYLAMQASHHLARAKCIQPRDAGSHSEPPPGVVLILIIPSVAATQGRIPPEQLEVPQEVKQEVHAYLDERRLLTSLLIVSEPEYVWVSSEAKVRLKPKADPVQVRLSVERELYRYFNPLFGGPEGKGWPFGRDLIVSEVYARIQSVSGVEYVEESRIHPVDVSSGKRGEAVQRLALDRADVLCSYEHRITVVTADEPE
jgi:predicted phage baseplate assembly protein